MGSSKEKKKSKKEKKKCEEASSRNVVEEADKKFKKDKKEKKRRRKEETEEDGRVSKVVKKDKTKKSKKSPTNHGKLKRKDRTDNSAETKSSDKLGPPRNKRKRSIGIREEDVEDSTTAAQPRLAFEYQHILAPMVGASELAFRILCRKYGAQLAYTPMMSSTEFVNSETYRQTEFQTVPEDRPLVCHFSANKPEEFAAAAKLVEDRCDAIDLNLGCPQRTAYVGHFGSYLLGKEDRALVLSIVREGAKAVRLPIFVKIRLLNTVEETVELCKQLRDAGASLIAVHARYRASFERTGPGARDGPAMLDQVQAIKKALGHSVFIISNGNVKTYEDVVSNMNYTKADGIMSAEGILDNPALFLPRLGPYNAASAKQVFIADPSPLPGTPAVTLPSEQGHVKMKRKLLKKLRQIEAIEEKSKASLSEDQLRKLNTKAQVQKDLAELVELEGAKKPVNYVKTKGGPGNDRSRESSTTKPIALNDLHVVAGDKVRLAEEYLSLVRRYPIKIRTVIFHVRRMCKDVLTQFQLMEECIVCKTIDDVGAVLKKCLKYRNDPESFVFDQAKAAREKEALEKKRREEGKRKAFEARMIRKAKREGKDSEYYLRLGAEVPTVETVKKLQSLPREEQLRFWKQDHSQHCISFHLDQDVGGCKRDRSCAFLHVAAKGQNTFNEKDEIAG